MLKLLLYKPTYMSGDILHSSFIFTYASLAESCSMDSVSAVAIDRNFIFIAINVIILTHKEYVLPFM